MATAGDENHENHLFIEGGIGLKHNREREKISAYMMS